MQKKNDLSKLILNKDKFHFILALDRGNTRDKFSLYDRREKRFLNKQAYAFEDLIAFGLNAENTLISLSDVSSREFTLPFHFILRPKELRSQNKLFNFSIHYEETLGEDRLIAAFYQYQMTQGPFCLIDSGTFTTVDFVDERGFQGGFILPGLALLQDSYNQGAKLRFERLKRELKELAHTTDDAISQGAYLSFLAPLFSLLENFNVKRLILTGEHAKEIELALQNHTNLRVLAIQHEPFLILKALTSFAEGVLDNAYFTRS